MAIKSSAITLNLHLNRIIPDHNYIQYKHLIVSITWNPISRQQNFTSSILSHVHTGFSRCHTYPTKAAHGKSGQKKPWRRRSCVCCTVCTGSLMNTVWTSPDTLCVCNCEKLQLLVHPTLQDRASRCLLSASFMTTSGNNTSKPDMHSSKLKCFQPSWAEGCYILLFSKENKMKNPLDIWLARSALR